MRAPSEKPVSRLSQWLRAALVGCFVVAVTGAGIFAYKYFTKPKTITIAAGSPDGEPVRVMTAIASRLARGDASIRLKIDPEGDPLEAARAFSAGRADLAIIRADMADISKARTVVLVSYAVVLIIVPPGAPGTIEGLKGKTVGVIAEEINRPVIEALTREYDLANAKVRFKDLAIGDAQQAFRTRAVSALLVVTPTSEKYLSMLRSIFAGPPNRRPQLVPIESADAIASSAQAYESYELPKGTVRGSPPVPDEDLTTLRVPFYLLANKNLSENVVTELTKAIMEARRDLLAEYPILAQVSAPSTDKDAYIPIHKGAAAFYEDTQQSWLDKYSNELFLFPVILGLLASFLTWARKFVIAGAEGMSNPLAPLHALAEPIRQARSDAELDAIAEEIDNIVQAQLMRQSTDKGRAGDVAVLSLASQRLERLIEHRRWRLAGGSARARYELSARGDRQEERCEPSAQEERLPRE
jgi:TRAP-type uncharacterized transport system substrate-binding protein